MAYITSEKVAEMRKEIKKVYPSKDGWKFSIRRLHGYEIAVDILASPVQMTLKGYEQVNHYYIDKHYEDALRVKKVLNKIYSIISKGNYDKSDVMTDYFNVGWYMSINIGRWDRPFIHVKPEIKKVRRVFHDLNNEGGTGHYDTSYSDADNCL